MKAKTIVQIVKRGWLPVVVGVLLLQLVFCYFAWESHRVIPEPLLTAYVLAIPAALLLVVWVVLLLLPEIPPKRSNG